MEDILFFLEIMGTVAFAISGAVLGIRKRMDIFGVSILGLTTGVGGGIIRDLIVGNNPPLTFQDPVYLVVSIITSIIVFLPVIRTWIFRETRFYEALMLLVGVITGCGGGVLRDMMAGDRPYIFVKHFYASASLLGALACILLWNRIGYGGAMLLGATSIVVLRLLAARNHWSLPKADLPEE